MQKAFEKIKVTSLEIIVTGKKDKPYFEIKYKKVGEKDYNIGYSSYDLNNVFAWKEECFEIVNQVAEEYVPEINVGNINHWIPVEERLPNESLDSVIGWDSYRQRCCFVQYYGGRWILGNDVVKITAWQPLPEAYRGEGKL